MQQIGTYVDGRELTYDHLSGAFAIGGTSVTLEQVLEYDAFDQIAWLSEDMRVWAISLRVDENASAEIPDCRSGRLLGFRSRSPVKMVLALAYYVFWLLFTLFAVLPSASPSADARDIFLQVLKGVMLSLLLITPALALSDFGYRERLPLFKRRNVLANAIGFATCLILFFVSFAVADSLHSPSYKAEAEAQRLAQQQEQERERAARLEREEQQRLADQERLEAESIAEQERLEAERVATVQKESAEREAELAQEKRRAEEERAAQDEAERQAALEAVRGTEEYQRLTSGGMSDVQARAFIDVAHVAGIKYIGEVVGRDATDEGDTFLVESRDSMVGVRYGVMFRGDEVSEVMDENLDKLYSGGKRNIDYVYWDDVGGPTEIKARTEILIKAILKSPSTAKFPGSFLSPLDGWGFEKESGEVRVSGYVDSQNSFGAMLRSQFVVMYRVGVGEKRGSITPVYVNFDGQVVLDDR
ncbi:MAG: hypothetical protein KGZ40_00720 [Clostridiales bacterium]|nr:hypothetical protein [Clostridiales bacterium]